MHTVVKGETLYRISKKYGVSVSELMRANSISDVTQLEVGQNLVIPGRFQNIGSKFSGSSPLSLSQVQALVGPAHPASRWQTITVHHSATKKGSAKLFHRDHMRRHMGGLFYHFVIGNGSYTKDGEIEVGWRWKKQVKANRPYDIQICMVGDFSKDQLSAAQFESLTYLVRTLKDQYAVPNSRIRRHCDVPGKHTECPGQYFPFDEMIARVSRPDGS